jgi:nucleoid DNA-binding protein
MTKSQLQIALAQGTQTNRRTAALFLDTLSSVAYKTIKNEDEFVLPGFGKLFKQKRKPRAPLVTRLPPSQMHFLMLTVSYCDFWTGRFAGVLAFVATAP